MPHGRPRCLLVGPYDPQCGEFTFLSPPLGVWRLAGLLSARGTDARVFDPNCCEEAPESALERLLRSEPWDVVGFSTTGMTLRFDLALAHLARRTLPSALLLAGGMEASFDPHTVMRLGPFDLAVLGEGERPLLAIVDRLRRGEGLAALPGTAQRAGEGVERRPQPALTREELRDAIFATPYEQMPYRAYWRKLERAYRVRELPFKADREARLAEIRSVRLITLNYCPMGCSFCSSTNFLNAAQDGTARVSRLTVPECMAMLGRIVSVLPDVRTVIFQDDIFAFPSDARLLPLCAEIERAKRDGELPRQLQFISTNRIDAMTLERLAALRRSGFRVLGFGVESFSREVLREFRKERIHARIEPVLQAALALGITPFLDLILTSPRSTLADLAETIRQGYRWTLAGCEAGMYPSVIPFSGAALAADPSLRPQTVYTRRTVAGTDFSWEQPTKIVPFDPELREVILSVEEAFERRLRALEAEVAHLPSRLRSLLWVACAVPALARRGHATPELARVLEALELRLPGPAGGPREALRRSFGIREERQAAS